MSKLTFILLFLTLNFLFAQPPDSLWTKTYGGSDYEIGRSLQITTDNGFIITGETGSYGSGGVDVYLIRTDENGDTLWTKTYGGTGDDRGFSIQNTTDGGYIIAGSSDPSNSGNYDVYLIKIDQNGDTLWTKNLGGSGYDEARSVQQTTDGGYIITGITNSFGSGNYDVYIIKTDADGNTLWARACGGAGWDEGNSVQQTADGGYIVTGISASYSSGDYDVYLVKTNPSGDTIWTKTYGMIKDEGGRYVIETSDGGYIVAGYIKCSTGAENTYLVKTDSNGDSLWANSYGNDYGVGAYCVLQTVDGGYIVTGGAWNFVGIGFDVYLLKVDSTGQELWSALYGKPDDWDIGLSVRRTSDNGYIIAGITHLFVQGDDDVYLVKTGPEIGIEEKLKRDPITKKLNLEIYPNPFKHRVNIKLQMPDMKYKSEEVSLKVYDMNGRVVKRFRLPTGYSQSRDVIIWSGKDNSGKMLSDGIYFLRLEAYDHIVTQKVIIVR